MRRVGKAATALALTLGIATGARAVPVAPEGYDTIEDYERMVNQPPPTQAQQSTRHKRLFRLLPGWSASVGLLVGSCLRQGETTGPGGDEQPVPCAPDFDDNGSDGTGNLSVGVDASVSYAATRHLSLTGSLFYEPVVHTVTAAVSSAYDYPLRKQLTLTHGLSLSAPFGASDRIPGDPLGLTWSETLQYTIGRWQLAGGPDAGISYGQTSPLDVRSTTASTAWRPSSAAAWADRLPPPPAASATTTPSVGLSVDAELELSRHWGLTTSLSATWLFSSETSTQLNASPLGVAYHYGRWQDTLTSEVAYVGTQGQPSYGLEASTHYSF